MYAMNKINRFNFWEMLMPKNEFKHESREELFDEIKSLRNEIAKLEDSEHLFKHYYDNIPAYVYIKDTDSNYFFINKKCEELFNITREKLKEHQYTDFDFFDVEMAKQLRENDKFVMQSGKSIETEEIGKPEGHHNIELEVGYRYYLALKFPLKNSDGKTIGVCGFSHDITKQKEMEERLRNTNKKLEKALDEIKTLRGIIPICSYCKKMRDDKGAWDILEAYISKHSDAQFSHGVCPECYKKLMEDLDS